MALQNKPRNIRVLESFFDGEYYYQISDHFFEGRPTESTRNLCFKNNLMPCFYLHSSVYLDLNRKKQPIYSMLQDIIVFWSRCNPISNALVLGAAGCTIPRFLVLQYPNCNVVGVEISSHMIEIAKKYFFIPEFDKRFQLINDDAFMYFDHCHYFEKYDLIYVDLFDGAVISENVFSVEYMSLLKDHLNTDALLAVNMLDVDYDKAYRFSSALHSIYEGVALVVDGSRIYLVLKNTRDDKWQSFASSIIEKYEIAIL